MKFLIDKKETDSGRFLADWELDKRLDILQHKYNYKEKAFKNEYMENLMTSTIRIKSLKQLREFMDDMEVDNIIISKDSGYYVSTGDLRIIVDIEEDDNEPEVVNIILGNDDVLGSVLRVSSYERGLSFP